MEKSAILGTFIFALEYLQSRVVHQFAIRTNPFKSILCLKFLKNFYLMFVGSDQSSCRRLIGIPKITNMGRGRPA